MIEEYAAFSRSFTKIRAQDIRDQIDAAYATRKYWPEPILQINPHYKRDKRVADLVRDGVLHPSCNVVFAGWELRTHQVQSIHIASAPEVSLSRPAPGPESPSASSCRSSTPFCGRGPSTEAGALARSSSIR